MKSIGGYHQLSLADHGSVYHDAAIAVNLCRTAFEYILRVRKVDRVYLPYFICDVMLQPLQRLQIPYAFYFINERLEPADNIRLGEAEIFVYVNYFGIKTHFVRNTLEQRYRDKLVVDNSQAFYAPPLRSTDSIYSPRKFFGLPDGGFLFLKNNSPERLALEEDYSAERCMHLLKRIDQGADEGFLTFRENDKSLDQIQLRKMSMLTTAFLKNIDFAKSLNQRNENFLKLHESLSKINKLSSVINEDQINGPLAYPLYIEDGAQLKQALIRSRIFIPTYWPGIRTPETKKEAIEETLVQNIVSLPIDQRYTTEDMQLILNVIAQYRAR